MKLIKCHIENFGKLSDFTYDFTDGCNTVCEGNGWGKRSTQDPLNERFLSHRMTARPLLRTASMPKSGIWRRIRMISIILRQRTSG